MSDSAKWYVIHTYSGYENAVKTSIEKFVTGRGMEDMILRMEIPMETVTDLQNIPVELYEAAKVDGANARVTFFKITLPYMLFVTAPTLIAAFIGNINNFNVIYLLSGGAPATLEYYRGTAGKTDLLVTWLYKLTIDNKDYCYGAVIGILTFVISIVISLVTYRRTSAYKNEEGFQ